MNPGRELDALVAEKVMGWEWWEWGPSEYVAVVERGLFRPGCAPPRARPWRGGDHRVWHGSLPSYSTSVADAVTVIEHLNGQGYNCCVHWFEYDGGLGPAHAHIYHPKRTGKGDREGASGHEAVSAPHAICLAALQAVGTEVPA